MAALVAHYQRVQGLEDWSFDVEVVRDLRWKGADAWATVCPALDETGKLVVGPDGKFGAQVCIRDIDATPIPNFDGDAMLEIRVTVSHELWHCAVAEFTQNPSIEAEERLVEAAAQAVVMSEDTEARVMARSVRALSPALRARVAARAPRARGGSMDLIDLILAAVEAAAQADDPKEALAALLGKVRAIKDGTPNDAAPPDTGEPGGEPAMQGRPDDPNKPAQPPGDAMEARRARAVATIEANAARSQAAVAEQTAITADMRQSGAERLVERVRARLPTDHHGLPNIEKRILGAKSYQEAKLIADVVIETAPQEIASQEIASQTRARGGAERGGAPPPAPPGPPVVPADELKGFDPGWIAEYQRIAKQDPAAAAVWLGHGRARLAKEAQRGRS